MVESADEPPLRGIHSWAKSRAVSSVIDTFRNKKDSANNNSILPQHAGHTDSTGASASHTTTENPANTVNTQQQGTSVVDEERNGSNSTTMTTNEKPPKQPVHQRIIRDLKLIITCSWINWLLVTVPVGILLGALNDWGKLHIVSPSVIFAINAVAIIPLASLLAFATESVALRMGDAWGALLNVTFGNAVEIIIFVIGLIANEVRIVQAAALGSILSNLLLILGMAFIFGGLRYREQVYSTSISQLSACLLSLSVLSLLLPTAFHAAFSDSAVADRIVVKVSRGTSVILLIVYIFYLIFQLKSHAFLYQSTPQHIIDEESHPGVLADMLNSSSSSSDSSSSSSSDSDTSTDSRKTVNRIRRALRRKRRKSSSSIKEDISLRTFNRSETNTDTLVEGHRLPEDGIFSGDEADGEERRGRSGQESNPVFARDFENETGSTKSKRRKQRKREKRAAKKEKKSRRANKRREEEAPPAFNEKAVPAIQVNFAQEVQEIPPESAKRPFHLRHISDAVKPTFTSANFPHHDAITRQLVLPSLRPQEKSTDSNIRRASSMPDINRRTSPARRPLSPSPVMALPAGIAETVDSGEDGQHRHLSQTSAIIMLLCTTGLVALCGEFLVDSIDYLVDNGGVSQAFIGLIILPIVGNAAEHVTAITVAYKNKMDLAIGIALGSSIQIALFVTPLMVILGWCIGVEMTLYFSLFETVSLFAATFIVMYLMIDGRSNYLEGILLIAAYVIIGILAYFYPSCSTSTANGISGSETC